MGCPLVLCDPHPCGPYERAPLSILTSIYIYIAYIAKGEYTPRKRGPGLWSTALSPRCPYGLWKGLLQVNMLSLQSIPKNPLECHCPSAHPCGSEDRPVLAQASGLDDGDEEDESDDYILGLLWPVEPSIRLVHNSEDSQKSRPCGSISKTAQQCRV